MIRKIIHHLFTKKITIAKWQLNLFGVIVFSAGALFGLYVLGNEVILPRLFALDDTTNIWTFNAETADNYGYDSNLVTIDGAGAYPAAGVNKFTNPSFTSEDISSWSLLPVSGSTTPTGWVPVPVNAGATAYMEGDQAFLVMKYSAKAWDTQADPPAVVADGGRDGGVGGWAGGNSQTRYEARSIAEGRPWVYIAQSHGTEFDSIEACSNISIGSTNAHLITNNEWMSIARNAEGVDANWSLGVGGSGYLFAGHNDNQPDRSLPASTTDTGDYRCAYTDVNGTVENPSPCPSNTASGTSGSTQNQVRTLTLSNGAVIWDLAGNVWEWTNDSIVGTDKPTGAGGNSWSEWNTISSWGTLSSLLTRPANSNYYDADYGVGQYYRGSATGGPYGFLRGGYWYASSITGAFALYLNLSPSIRDLHIGFRCASDPVEISISRSSSSGRLDTGSGTVTVGSLFDGKLVQSINVGSTATFNLSVYVHSGGEVAESVAQLYYNGAVIETNYEPAEDGWYKLSGTLTGANESREFGVLVKSGLSVKVDDLTLSKQAEYSVYNLVGYTNPQVSSWDSLSANVTASGDSAVYYQICLDDGASCGYSGDSRWQYYTGGVWTDATDGSITYANSLAQLTTEAMQDLPTDSQKISVKAIMVFGGDQVPMINSLTVGLTTDTTPPGNISAISMKKNIGVGSTMAENDWTNNSSPYFSWDEAVDNAGGAGIKGYCLFITLGDTEPNLQTGLSDYLPRNTNLDAVHISSEGTDCGNGSGFLVSTENINFANANYRGSTWLSSSSTPYYLWIKAIDNAGNIADDPNISFHFRFDNTSPTNVTYISPASGSFSNVADMSFSWPTLGSVGVGSTDAHSEVLGWQYQINSMESNNWKGTTHQTVLDLDYIPATASAYSLIPYRDEDDINSGNNVVYFRTVDVAGNFSTDATVRTGNLQYGGAAPAFDGLDRVTVTPGTAEANSFALSWPEAEATVGRNVAKYYYMINTSPPGTLATLQGNATTYIDNGAAVEVSATALPNVNKGSNTVYVVAIDDAPTPNYSPSNYITGTFILDSTTPDNVGNLVASDSSIKSQSQWNVTLTWTAPSYQGAGNLTYLVYRSADGTTFAQVGTTSGLSYVDNTPSSALYYYKVYTKDGANATSSGTNAVSITPTGKWTSAPSLNDGPNVGSITTKKATITWSTSRSSDSKVQFGTSSGSYNTEEPSNSSQVTSHTINLTGLEPGTTYYYRAKWTDEDGNTGTSEEKNFTTTAAPNAKEVTAKNIGLFSAFIQYTTTNASKVKIYYGKTASFGGVKEVSTSTSETTYTTELSGLEDGTKYFYKINTFDSDNSEYEGNIYSFETLPRPRISNVRLQQVANTAQSTVLVTWNTNTEVSSIVTSYPLGNPGEARDDVNVALTRGEHRMIVRGLLPQTDYVLVVKGRDKIGNEAVSESHRFTTATDTRPPQISELRVQGSTIPPVASTAQESTAQLVVSWNTDEPATSQVEFGEGTGTTYSQKTQEETNLKYNHLVIISNLTPSKVYHLRALSRDKAGNLGQSIDTVTIAPKATENALNLVITNLQEAFGFLGGIKR
ncbi:MAG: fibronectin type III domain-containing protein [Patescibacteria group bacterium]|jgi:hypothetical protein